MPAVLLSLVYMLSYVVSNNNSIESGLDSFNAVEKPIKRRRRRKNQKKKMIFSIFAVSFLMSHREKGWIACGALRMLHMHYYMVVLLEFI